MEVLALQTLPKSGDYIRVGPHLYLISSFDAKTRLVWYVLDYAHRDNPISLRLTGYSLMDGPEQKPRIWRRVGDRFRFHLKFRLNGKMHDWERTAVSRAAARAHVLHVIGQQALPSDLSPGAYTAKGKSLIAEANGKSQYDESMIEVIV